MSLTVAAGGRGVKPATSLGSGASAGHAGAGGSAGRAGAGGSVRTGPD
ncbi:MAG TPA: hypothetical protein VGP46_12335 [Acidimicrobiales bacterium]|nr:hypothetical protein [Acidimicrobiales bacterium]